MFGNYSGCYEKEGIKFDSFLERQKDRKTYLTADEWEDRGN